MNKSESKYFNTALCMNEALIALLEVKDMEYITVKEICEKAGVNRSTFYLHYETLSDLLDETAQTVNKRFLSYFAENAGEFTGDIDQRSPEDLVLISRDYLYPYLNFIKDNKKIFRAAFRNPDAMQVSARYGYIKGHIIEPILKRFGIPDMFRKYYTAYYVEGTMAVIREWLGNDCRESVEEISAVIEKCVRPSDGAVWRGVK